MLTNGDICACKFTQWGAETVSHELSEHSATTGNFGKLGRECIQRSCSVLLDTPPGATFWAKGLLWS